LDGGDACGIFECDACNYKQIVKDMIAGQHT
jgi:hypothetical protein